MASDSHGLQLPFPLDAAARFLEGFRRPTRAHDPAGDWALSYRVLTLTGLGGEVGRLRIERKAVAGGTQLVVREQRRLGRVGTRTVDAKIRCAVDVLATPATWRFTAQSTAKAGAPVPYTSLSKSGAVDGRTLTIDVGRRQRRVALDGPWTVHWALFEAVGRLARQPFEPIRFTLHDHFDQVKANQTLSFRGETTVRLGQRRVRKQRWVQLEKGRIRKTFWAYEGGEPTRLFAYDHTGDGVVPWVYWVDEQGRLLFAVSGLEAYVLDTRGGGAP